MEATKGSKVKIEHYERKSVNSQMYLGPPKWWPHRCPEPGVGTEIFIKNIPTDVEVNQLPDRLFRLCQQFGVVYQIRCPITFEGSKGFAYVRFTDRESATKAISTLNGHMTGGRLLKVERSRDTRSLIIFNWPTHFNEARSRFFLQEALQDGEGNNVVNSVKIFPDRETGDANLGFIVVEFISHNAAAVARRDIINNNKLAGFTKSSHTVDWTRKDNEVPEDQFHNLTELHISNLPPDTSKTELLSAIEFRIDAAVFPHVIPKIKSEGFAFLYFPTHQSAEESLIKLRGKPLMLRGKQLSFSWAKGPFIKNSKPDSSPSASPRMSMTDPHSSALCTAPTWDPLDLDALVTAKVREVLAGNKQVSSTTANLYNPSEVSQSRPQTPIPRSNSPILSTVQYPQIVPPSAPYPRMFHPLYATGSNQTPGAFYSPNPSSTGTLPYASPFYPSKTLYSQVVSRPEFPELFSRMQYNPAITTTVAASSHGSPNPSACSHPLQGSAFHSTADQPTNVYPLRPQSPRDFMHDINATCAFRSDEMVRGNQVHLPVATTTNRYKESHDSGVESLDLSYIWNDDSFKLK